MENKLLSFVEEIKNRKYNVINAALSAKIGVIELFDDKKGYKKYYFYPESSRAFTKEGLKEIIKFMGKK
jgi:hypothetical protein